MALNPPHRSTHAPDADNPDVLFPLLWAYLMDREEVGHFVQVFTAYGAQRICWMCNQWTSLFNQPDNTPEKMRELARRRQDMFELLRDTPEMAQEYSIHHFPPLAMDVCSIVPVDYDWVLPDRFHHMTVVMWRVKCYTEVGCFCFITEWVELEGVESCRCICTLLGAVFVSVPYRMMHMGKCGSMDIPGVHGQEGAGHPPPAGQAVQGDSPPQAGEAMATRQHSCEQGNHQGL